MRVLVFGAGGQVGAETIRCAGPLAVDATPVDRTMCDLAEPGAAARLIRASAPDAVINAAAYTAVDKAESERGLAQRINGDAPGEMAAACAETGAPLVHFSTDYVFDGRASSPYREDDPTAPANVYGKTKLDGEHAVRAAGASHAIIRLSWVFSAHGANFVKTMVRLGRERDTLRVVGDQHGKPTPASAAAVAGLIAARALADAPALSGVYHFAGDEPTTWAEFAGAIFDAAGMAVAVEQITTDEYPTPAARPAWSVLATEKFTEKFGVAAPSWRDELSQIMPSLLAAYQQTETPA